MQVEMVGVKICSFKGRGLFGSYIFYATPAAQRGRAYNIASLTSFAALIA